MHPFFDRAPETAGFLLLLREVAAPLYDVDLTVAARDS
ncbi:MAG: hypothetical protein ACI8UO_006467 [Verrucomicrobiales bacterium]|jgi:hypothetical protein